MPTSKQGGRELGLTRNPSPQIPIQGTGREVATETPDARTDEAIEKRYKHAHYVMPPLDERGWDLTLTVRC